jgi:hypothetical protein
MYRKPRKPVLPEYYDFLPLFLEEGLQQLPPKCLDINYKINVKPDFQPPFGSLCGLLQTELKAQKKW